MKRRNKDQLLEDARVAHLLLLGMLAALRKGSIALEVSKEWLDDYDRDHRPKVLARLARKAIKAASRRG